MTILASVISEPQSISSEEEEQGTALKAFLKWKICFCYSDELREVSLLELWYVTC